MTQASALDRDVLCPLCDYNLRGLIHPRCPECGHQFDWPELLDRRWEHPWLFEHQRKRRIRSFFRTFWAGLLPWRFWKSARPTHLPNPRRLVIYWSVFAVLLGVAMAWLAFPIAWEYYGQYVDRRALAQRILARPSSPEALWHIRIHGSAQAAAQDLSKLLALRNVLTFVDRRPLARAEVLVPSILMYLAWPWVTLLTLKIFRGTMRRVQIKPGHAARCAIYSFDGGILMAAPLVAVVWWFEPIDWSDKSWAARGIGPLLDAPVLVVLICGLLLLTCRMMFAYRMYLRFPHAVATCILTQAVVAMIMFTAYVFFAP